MKLPEPRDPTLEAVDRAIVQSNRSEVRTYVGASEIGHPCDRRLWLKYHWVEPEHIDATGLRNIQDGFAGEPVMADRLKAVPEVNLKTEGPDGKQWGVSAHAGHFRGHLDGAIKGLLQAPKTWHVWEHKQVNEKRFRDLERKKEKFGEKNALAAWNETYFAQAQVYMGLTKSKRHYLTVASAGGRQITSVRTDFQKIAFDVYMEKAKYIIESPEAPQKVSAKGDYFICKWCHFNKFCHEETTTAQVNCRTCAHATPIMDEKSCAPGKLAGRGAWRCEYHSKTLTLKEQRKGCGKHLFIPDLIPWAHVAQMDKLSNTITYATNNKKMRFVNAEKNDWTARPKHFTSKDLQHVDAYNIENDDTFLEHMARFDPSIISNKKGKRGAEPLPFDDPLPEL